MNMIKKIRVVVLFGGNSNEKETSLDSGRNVIYKLFPQKYEVIPVFVSSAMKLFIINNALLVCNSTKEIEQSLAQAIPLFWSDLPKVADFVFIALHGGLGENGGVQGTLEMLNMPYNGSSVLASALCMDKFKTNQYLRSREFCVPTSLLISKNDWTNNREQLLQTIMQTFSLPVIVKPHDDGCSVMVYKITQPEELAPAIDHMFTHHKDQAMIEEFITGMELTVGVMGNAKAQALPPSQAIATGSILSIEEKFLPGAGENQTPAPLPPHTLEMIQQVMEKIYMALECKGYARIDCFYQAASQSPTGQERIIIIEVNTLPGLTPATCIFHQAAEIGLRPADFIDRIVQLGLEEHTRERPEQPQHHEHVEVRDESVAQ